MRLLLTQLYDPAPEITEVAVQFLEEVCESKEFLQMVVELQPAMSHLGDIGDALLLKWVSLVFWYSLIVELILFSRRFMSTSMGFRYLFEAGHIEKEIDNWFHVSIVMLYIPLYAHLCDIGTELVVCRRHWDFSHKIIQYGTHRRQGRSIVGWSLWRE